ncbi:hypothetical protein DM02DRAFT_542163 [Periconia macrospinosa]|uniref:Uncharacterized protein n=1 Tax=Periconia macrospinosa TaxID=97972 RepID=A0A2V1D520_9PLEO|nr:hypothetical protein DM02DRAFT_542163 [Periconia macrospinosa]
MARNDIFLVSVNKTPPRAASLIEEVLAQLQPRTNITHVANSASLETLETIIRAVAKPPGILICSSQWSIDEQKQANNVAQSIVPGIELINIPPGLDVREGGKGIVKFLVNAIQDFVERA